MKISSKLFIRYRDIWDVRSILVDRICKRACKILVSCKGLVEKRMICSLVWPCSQAVRKNTSPKRAKKMREKTLRLNVREKGEIDHRNERHILTSCVCRFCCDFCFLLCCTTTFSRKCETFNPSFSCCRHRLELGIVGNGWAWDRTCVLK